MAKYPATYNGVTYYIDIPDLDPSTLKIDLSGINKQLQIDNPWMGVDWSKLDFGRNVGPNTYDPYSLQWKQLLTPEWYDKNYLPTYESIKQEIDLIRQGVFLVDGHLATDADLERLYEEKLKVIRAAVPKYKARMEEIAKRKPGLAIDELIAPLLGIATLSPPPFGTVALGISTLVGVFSASEAANDQKRAVAQLQWMQYQSAKITVLYKEVDTERQTLMLQRWLKWGAIGLGGFFGLILFIRLIKAMANK